MVNFWKSRNLTPYDKTVVIKSLLMSKLTHLLPSLPSPDKHCLDNRRRQHRAYVVSMPYHTHFLEVFFNNFNKWLAEIGYKSYILSLKRITLGDSENIDLLSYTILTCK